MAYLNKEALLPGEEMELFLISSCGYIRFININKEILHMKF
jgi:hypothetical protein